LRFRVCVSGEREADGYFILFICFIPAFALVSIPDFSFIKDFTLRPSTAELLNQPAAGLMPSKRRTHIAAAAQKNGGAASGSPVKG